MAVDDAFGVKFWHAGDGFGARAGVEIYYFGVGVFEGEDDGVGWEDREGGMEFLEEGLVVSYDSGEHLVMER